LGGEMQADAALGVAGGKEDVAGEGWRSVANGSDGDDAALFEGVVGRVDFGGGHAEPAGLHIHHLHQGKIAGVVEDGRAGEFLEAGGAGDVVDVSVGDEDLLDGEAVALKQGHDARNVVARVDDDSLAGGFVTEDGAVALQHADGEDFVDHRRPACGVASGGAVGVVAEVWARFAAGRLKRDAGGRSRVRATRQLRGKICIRRLSSGAGGVQRRKHPTAENPRKIEAG